MHFLHPGLIANSACWPGCEICLLAKMKKMHSGSLRANSAFLVSANSARLMSAKIARDSYHYSFKTTLNDLRGMFQFSRVKGQGVMDHQ
jgi:hypothetical protein